uniref:Uncharacterized protein n=1 Tax=Nelumbo nucifera TaxID=4432 RepID=A0A822ZRM4_NELNU|nr:TPA_asm: hypothetical protein HUJ06_018521 [Nelumbo nucifera]
MKLYDNRIRIHHAKKYLEEVYLYSRSSYSNCRVPIWYKSAGNPQVKEIRCIAMPPQWGTHQQVHLLFLSMIS